MPRSTGAIIVNQTNANERSQSMYASTLNVDFMMYFFHFYGLDICEAY